MTNFMTEKSKKDLIEKVKGTSHQEKIEHFVKQAEQYRYEMAH